MHHDPLWGQLVLAICDLLALVSGVWGLEGCPGCCQPLQQPLLWCGRHQAFKPLAWDEASRGWF